MDDIYSLIEDSAKEPAPDALERYSKEEWKQRKQQERDDAYALGDDTALRVNADPQALDGYLNVMARFPERSALNNLLIYAQRPDATRIGDRRHWRDEHARVKGEGFVIIEQGNAYEREDGTLGSYYNATRVYDASETTARKVLPRRYQEANVVAAMVKTAVPRIVAADLQGELAVYDHEAKTIHFQKGLDPSQVFWALATELCQSEFARRDGGWSRDAYFNRAEIATTALAKRYGIEPPFGDLPSPAPRDADAKEVREALSDVQAAVKAVSRRAAKELDKPKERDQALAR